MERLNNFFIQLHATLLARVLCYLPIPRYDRYMYTSELIHDYAEYLEIERGRSSKTSENYIRYLERFIEFAGDV